MADQFSSFPDLQDLSDGVRWHAALHSFDQRKQSVYCLVVRWDPDGTRHGIFARVHAEVAEDPRHLRHGLAGVVRSKKSNVGNPGWGWEGLRDSLIQLDEEETETS